MVVSNSHPIEPLAKTLEKAFEAIDNPDLLPVLKDHPDYVQLQLNSEGGSYSLSINLEDVNPDELNMTLEGEVLTIRCGQAQAAFEEGADMNFEKYTSENDEANPYPNTEHSYVPFTYEISMPESVDSKGVDWSFVDDALQMELPKASAVPQA